MLKKFFFILLIIFFLFVAITTILFTRPIKLIGVKYKKENTEEVQLDTKEKLVFIYTFLLKKDFSPSIKKKMKLCSYKDIKYYFSFKQGVVLNIDRTFPIAMIGHNQYMNQYGQSIKKCNYTNNPLTSIENDATFSVHDISFFIKEVINKIYYISKAVLIQYQIYLYTENNREIYYGQLEKTDKKNKIVNFMETKNWKFLDVNDGKIVLFTE